MKTRFAFATHSAPINFLQRFLIPVMLVLMISSCRKGYKIEDDQVYYEYWNEGSGQHTDPLTDADVNSFEILEFDDESSFAFGRDKQHLFIDGRLMRRIHAASFQFIGDYFYADKDSVYFLGFYNDINDCSVKGIRRDQFQLISYPWARAGKTLIHGNDTLTLTDIETFEPLDEDWGKTRSCVINNATLLPGADPASFEIINSFTGKDKHHTYEFGKVVN